MGQQPRQPTPEEVTAFYEADKEWRMTFWPPQIGEDGKVRLCVMCHNPLHPLENRKYDATTGGYCDMMCRRTHEKKLMDADNMTPQEASDEVDKVEIYKPLKELPVGV